MPVGDPQGKQARAIDTDRQHPTGRPEEPPASYGRKQLIALGVIVVVGIVLWFLPRWV